MGLFSKKKTSGEDEEQKKLAEKVKKMYQDSYSSKSGKHSKWDDFYNAYTGDYFKQKLPSYKNQNIENFVFSTVETVKPVMLSENPKIQALPQSEKVQGKSDSVQKALDYEWMRAHMLRQVGLSITNFLIYGTAIMGILWDKNSQNGLGNVLPVVVSPFNFFIDPAATTIDEAEYIIYATYKSVGEMIRMCPEKKEEIMKQGASPSDSWLLHGNSNISELKNRILCLECYFRDYTTELTEVEEEDGVRKVEKYKYPKGRQVILAGDVVIVDGENAYRDGKFPFVSMNCYDVPGEFWGMGEVEQILSPTNSVNVLTNSIMESAELMANPIWVLDKNCGVAKNSLTNRKGLVIRKNPGTEVRREAPPPMPAYLQNIIDNLKADIENISGVYDVTRGEKPTGITAAAAIQALNEQAQGRIKLKVQALEVFLGEVGGMWLSRIQQFWVSKRAVMIMGEDSEPKFDYIDGDDVDGDFDIKIVAGSTMPINRASKLQQVIQLGQTMAEDGLPVVDRQTILENADIFNMKEVLARFQAVKDQQAQQQQAQNDALLQQEQMKQQFELQKLQMEIEAKNGMQVQQMQAQHQAEIQNMQGQNQIQMDQFMNQKQMEHDNALAELQKTAVPHQEVAGIIQSIPPEVLMQIAQSNPRMLEIINQISANTPRQAPQDSQGGI